MTGGVHSLQSMSHNLDLCLFRTNDFLGGSTSTKCPSFKPLVTHKFPHYLMLPAKLALLARHSCAASQDEVLGVPVTLDHGVLCSTHLPENCTSKYQEITIGTSFHHQIPGIDL